MWHETWNGYIALLKQKVLPALGCTEPVSTALAAAYAAELLGKTPEVLEIYVSGNLLKNGMGVGIPGTGEVGLPIAAALGALGGDSQKGLQVLASVTTELVTSAKQMVLDGKVTISVKETDSVLFSEVIAYSGNDKARVIIKDDHTQVTLKQFNDQIVFSEQSDSKPSVSISSDKPVLSIADIYQFATTADLGKLQFINQAAELNKALSADGLSKEYGLQVGKTIQRNIAKGWLSDDLAISAMMRSSAASDARMDGAMLPAMSNSGSGNQGIAATMPVVAVAEKINATDEQLTRALILSHLSSIHIKSHLNALSALCAVTTAGTGSSAAITWLLGGELPEVENAIFNMLGDVSGIFCDGAKTGCSLKVSTSASAAVKAALMAVDGIRVTCNEGVIEQCVEKSIDNIGLIGSNAMQETDKMIIDIMMKK